MTFYSVHGNTFRQSANLPVKIVEALPSGTYTLKKDLSGFYFEQIDNFELPKKVYGDLTRNRDRILNTFLDRSNATGVMLAGEKGSGKTLLGKALSIEAAATHDIPTIVLNTPYCGDEFNTLVQEMHQPAIFFFDEFEKVYSEDSQEAILTLLDGVYPTKKLFIITTNDKWKVDRHMRNRPGRIFYMLDFAGLDREFIREYAEDNLDNKAHVNSVMVVASLFSEFNFDMLKALVEEMNRYKETAQDAMRMLNAKPEFSTRRTYDLTLLENGIKLPPERVPHMETWSGNPVNSSIEISYLKLAEKQPKAKKKDGVEQPVEPAYEYEYVEFDPNDIISIKDDVFTYQVDNLTLVLTKEVPPTFNVLDRFT